MVAALTELGPPRPSGGPADLHPAGLAGGPRHASPAVQGADLLDGCRDRDQPGQRDVDAGLTLEARWRRRGCGPMGDRVVGLVRPR